MLRVACIALLTGVWCPGQTLSGVIDIHVHSDPDSIPRSIDAVDLARLAKSRGMGGLCRSRSFRMPGVPEADRFDVARCLRLLHRKAERLESKMPLRGE